MNKFKIIASALALIATLSSCQSFHYYTEEEMEGMARNCTLDYFARQYESYKPDPNKRIQFYKQDETDKDKYVVYKENKGLTDFKTISFYLRKDPVTKIPKVEDYGQGFIKYEVMNKEFNLYLLQDKQTVICHFMIHYVSPRNFKDVIRAYQLSSRCYEKIYEVFTTTQEAPDDSASRIGSSMHPDW